MYLNFASFMVKYRVRVQGRSSDLRSRFKKMRDRQDKPHFLVYLAYFGLYAIALNTVYLVLPNDFLAPWLIGLLAVAMMTGYLLNTKHYVTVGIVLDLAGLVVFIFYGYKIYQDHTSFGTYLGEMLSVMMVLRAFKLFRMQDFLPPLVISLTLMVFSAIPSFSGTFVYSLLGFLLLLGFAMFMASIDEFARLPRRSMRNSRLKYTYDFLEDYAPVPTSRKSPKQLSRFVGPAIKASIPAVLLAFTLSSCVYFQVDHTQTPGANSAFLNAFGNSGITPNSSSQQRYLTGMNTGSDTRRYVGFDTEFNIAQGRLIEDSTSTEVVMEVESNLPSNWRGKCFDIYTGRGWTQSEDIKSATWSLDPPAANRTQYHGIVDYELEQEGIALDPQALKNEVRQTYYLKSNLPGIVFTAYQPIEISIPVPAVLIDETFTITPPPSADSMVAGQVYEIVSRKHFAVESELLANDYNIYELRDLDPEFYERFTSLPESSNDSWNERAYDFQRVRAKAFEVTAGLDTVYERVEALIDYLDDEYKYSLNPPSAVPSEKDAVDYWLFDYVQRRGHCEYFSSSLAVMCRTIGIPARVVTGYSTGNYSILTNRYEVQERHAHAWTEIYWPDIGWVEFDPTPVSWLAGLGETAAGGWLSFNNAIENLYVFDPKGFINGTVLPTLGYWYNSSKIFASQKELEYTDTIQPFTRMLRENQLLSYALLLGAFGLLIGLVQYRRITDLTLDKRSAIRLGQLWLKRMRKKLIKNGVDEDQLATEMDVALLASGISRQWSGKIRNAVDRYQKAKYSDSRISHADYIALKKACRDASRIPSSG